MSRALDGLVAIVTGGASGIGAAIAERLHEDGADIAVLDRDTSGADPRFAAFTADVSDRGSVETAVAGVTAAALPWLRRSPAASVCNTASIASTTGLPQRALYSASKGAVSALTRAMAADHLREGIRVNAVNPGTADTPWVGRLLDSAADPAAERAALEARQPHGRLVSPAEVAGAVAYLVSPASGSTTGTFIEVDGGMAALRLRPA